jgi:hypothetical protein
VAVSTIGVADAAAPDKYLHTHQRTISATAREDQYVQQGESAYPTYVASAYNIALDTVDDHVIQVMGDGTNYSRIKRIEILPRRATTATAIVLRMYRLSTAGTGGTSVTAQPFDTSDTYGGTAMTLPSSKGTEGVALPAWTLPTMATSSPGFGSVPFVWEPPPGTKPIIFGTATSNGIAIKNMLAVTGGLVTVNIIFTTTSYL